MLHVDTGMARLGLTQPEFEALATAEPPVRGEIRWRALISHLACADQPGHSLNDIQRRSGSTRARGSADAACLPAWLRRPGSFSARRFTSTSCAQGLHSMASTPQPGTPNPMRRIVRLKGRILQVREVDRGDPVGYGAAHVMDRPGRLATVAIGYADGWFRSLSPRGSGRLGGTRVPLIGRVSMDLVVFDVSAVDPRIGSARQLYRASG